MKYFHLPFCYYTSRAAQAAAALAAQTCGGKSSRGRPAPLLRSRTLPAIIVPGISILHTQIDPNRLNTGELIPSMVRTA